MAAAAAELRQRAPAAKAEAGPIDVNVVDKAKSDPYDESDLPAFTPSNFTMKEVSTLFGLQELATRIPVPARVSRPTGFEDQNTNSFHPPPSPPRPLAPACYSQGVL